MVGETIKALREQRKWTQTDLAKKVCMAKSTISMIERGNRLPSYEALEAFADAFNVDMNMLTGKQTDDITSKIYNVRELINGDPELTEYLQGLSERAEMRMLYHVTKNATKEQIEAIVRMVESMNGK